MANFTITLPGQYISPLVNPEQKNDYNIRYQIPSSVVAVASATGNADTVTIILGTTPANWVCSGAYAYVATAFAGTTALSMTVGTTTVVSAFLASTSVLTNALIQPANGANTTNLPTSSTASASVTVEAIFTNATGGSPSALTAGLVEILVNMVDLNAVY